MRPPVDEGYAFKGGRSYRFYCNIKWETASIPCAIKKGVADLPSDG